MSKQKLLTPRVLMSPGICALYLQWLHIQRQSLPADETKPGKAGILEYSPSILPRVEPRSHSRSGTCRRPTDPESNGNTHVLTHPSNVWRVLPFPHWLEINEIVRGTAVCLSVLPASTFALYPICLVLDSVSRVTHKAKSHHVSPLLKTFQSLCVSLKSHMKHCLSSPITSLITPPTADSVSTLL